MVKLQNFDFVPAVNFIFKHEFIYRGNPNFISFVFLQ